MFIFVKHRCAVKMQRLHLSIILHETKYSTMQFDVFFCIWFCLIFVPHSLMTCLWWNIAGSHSFIIRCLKCYRKAAWQVIQRTKNAKFKSNNQSSLQPRSSRLYVSTEVFIFWYLSLDGKQLRYWLCLEWSKLLETLGNGSMFFPL